MLEGEIEVDESYFGGHHKGKRDRGAAGKVAVFGLLKRGERVYAVVIPDERRGTLLPIIRQKVKPDSIVYTDTFKSYDTLDVSGFRYHRVNHSKTYVDGAGNHINGIENFWGQAKRHLRKYNGIPRDNFPLFLKEYEWRFNEAEMATRLKQLRAWMRKDYHLFAGNSHQSTVPKAVKGKPPDGVCTLDSLPSRCSTPPSQQIF